MADAFTAEIRIFGFTFAPRDWAFCDGQLLPISQNSTLHGLIGNTYGGDGVSTFGLPDLRGRAVIGPDQGPGLTQRQLGEAGGAATVLLSEAELPAHNHSLLGSAGTADRVNPEGAGYASSGATLSQYGSGAETQMAAGLTSEAGGTQAHNNRQPHLLMNYCICLQGDFPPPG